MSGPVSNSLAQLEDALLEAGLDKDVIISALVTELHSLTAADVRLNPFVPQKRQRVWDHLAALWPDWRDMTIVLEHEEALRAERWRMEGLSVVGWRPLNFGLFHYSAAPRAVAIALGRGSGKTAMTQAAIDAQITVAEVNQHDAMVRARSRVPEFLQHKPGRRPKR